MMQIEEDQKQGNERASDRDDNKFRGFQGLLIERPHF
jgi:hypothetical protein